jgi:hypothetical protein
MQEDMKPAVPAPLAHPPALAALPDAGEPTTAFRRQAWLDFQRSLDPLGAPRPLKRAFRA